jgi:MFS family permease
LGKVQVWASQLWANDFPPVCAMTGRPAETWKKFSFATPPDWAYALLFLVCLGGIGIAAFAVVVALVSQRASGYLPLTRSSARTVTLAFWIPLGLLIAWPVAWAIAAIFGFGFNDSTSSTIAGVFFWLGIVFLITGLLGRLLIMRLTSPQAKVFPTPPGQTDRIVELRNVHPAFVAAVQQHQHARAAPYSPAPQAPLLPS